MPEAKQTPAENLPWKSIVTVVVGLASSGLLLFPFLISSRPNIPWGGRSEGMSIQDIDARLWQDPLEAIESKQHLPVTLYEKRTHSVELVRENLTKDSSAPLILAVMVNGAGYPEKIERRLRDRVAVENALARAGYTPNDPEHLGSFTIPWSRYPETLCNIRPLPPTLVPSATPKSLWEGNIDSTHLALTAGPKASGPAEAQNQEGGRALWRRGSGDNTLMGGEDHIPLTVPFELH